MNTEDVFADDKNIMPRDAHGRLLSAVVGFAIGSLCMVRPPPAAGLPSPVAQQRRASGTDTFRSCALRNAIAAGASCQDVASSSGEDGGFSWYAPLPTFRQKGDLPRILEAEGRHSVGVEVGVLDGRFAEWMLRTWKSARRYYLVDPWVAHDETYRDASKQSKSDADRFMDMARQRMAPFGDRAVLLRNFSADASQLFSDQSVDFVFIDARHSYDAVLEDLKAWWPKIRPGGILAGHDYVDADELWRFSTCQWGWPWRGCEAHYKCVQWDKACDSLPDAKRQGSRDALAHNCGQDWSVQADGSRRVDHKAVRSAVDEFAAEQGRQVAVSYRDVQQAFFFETWAIRR